MRHRSRTRLRAAQIHLPTCTNRLTAMHKSAHLQHKSAHPNHKLAHPNCSKLLILKENFSINRIKAVLNLLNFFKQKLRWSLLFQ